MGNIIRDNVTFINDKKEKYQSVEAYYVIDLWDAMWNGRLELTAYGANEDEAFKNLLECLSEVEARQKKKDD